MFRSFLPMSNLTGEYPVDKGVEQYASMANSLSFSFSACSLLFGLLARLLHLTVGIWDCLGLF